MVGDVYTRYIVYHLLWRTFVDKTRSPQGQGLYPQTSKHQQVVYLATIEFLMIHLTTSNGYHGSIVYIYVIYIVHLQVLYTKI